MASSIAAVNMVVARPVASLRPSARPTARPAAPSVRTPSRRQVYAHEAPWMQHCLHARLRACRHTIQVGLFVVRAVDPKENPVETAKKTGDWSIEEGPERTADKAKDTASDLVEGAKKNVESTAQNVKDKAADAGEDVKKNVDSAAQNIKKQAPDVGADAENTADNVVDTAADLVEGAKKNASSTVQNIKEKVGDIGEAVSNSASETKDFVKEAVDSEGKSLPGANIDEQAKEVQDYVAGPKEGLGAREDLEKTARGIPDGSPWSNQNA